MFDVSVIICAHNPRPHYLGRVLAALRNQTLAIERWELLLVDNASHPPLGAGSPDLSWNPAARILREEELGLSAARMRGIREAAALLLVFVDDDNVLDPNYLEEALSIAREWPQLGVWGGSVIHEYEVEPPAHLHEFVGALGLRDVKSPRWSNLMTGSDALPIGAGLCLRTNIANGYSEHAAMASIKLSGRKGDLLLSGEDFDICYYACRAGFGMGLFPQLRLLHLIPKERLDERYLVRLSEGIHVSLFLLRYKWLGVSPPSYFTPSGLLRFIRDFYQFRGLRRRTFLAEVRAAKTANRIIRTELLTSNSLPGVSVSVPPTRP